MNEWGFSRLIAQAEDAHVDDRPRRLGEEGMKELETAILP